MKKDEYDSWRCHGITQDLFQYMRDYSAELAQNLVATDYGSRPSDEVARIQAQTYGMCSVLEDIINLTAGDKVHLFLSTLSDSTTWTAGEIFIQTWK